MTDKCLSEKMPVSVMKNTDQRRALALALRYQKRFPGIVEGERVEGRIAPEKRADFIKEFARIMIDDSRLREILFDPAESDGSKKIMIAAHVVGKNEFSLTKAVRELRQLASRLCFEGGGGYEERQADILRLASIRKLSPEKSEIFQREMHHAVSCSSVILCGPIGGASWHLEKEIEAHEEPI